MILVFGSINVDVVVPVPHLPSPGETVLGGNYRLLGGGKGANQALAAHRAGAEVALVGAVGADGFAAVALDPLRDAGVDTSLVLRLAEPTGLAVIMVSHNGENAIAVASGANAGVRADQVPHGMLGPGTVLVTQMEVPIGETASMIRQARASGGSVVHNLAPALPLDPVLLREIDYLVANEGEAAALGAEPASIAARLGRALVVTRGGAGAVASLADGGTLRVPALSIDPVDTTGAGDTFVGVLASALDRGASLELALRRASAAAGLACLAQGAQTAMPDKDAIDRAVERLPPR